MKQFSIILLCVQASWQAALKENITNDGFVVGKVDADAPLELSDDNNERKDVSFLFSREDLDNFRVGFENATEDAIKDTYTDISSDEQELSTVGSEGGIFEEIHDDEALEINELIDVKIPSMPKDILEAEEDGIEITTAALDDTDNDDDDVATTIVELVDVKIPSMPDDLDDQVI